MRNLLFLIYVTERTPRYQRCRLRVNTVKPSGRRPQPEGRRSV